MKIKEYVAHKLIGTSLETWARKLRDITQISQRIKHPELHNIYLESARTKLAMSRIIHNSMNCIDVGAHLGSVLSLINCFSPNGKHIAIEPIPYKYHWLRQKFPHVEVLSMAVSDTQEEANFYIPCRSSFSGLGLRHYTRDTEQNIEIIKVNVNRLDDIVPDDLVIGFIKIDVEGAELLALRGSESILRRCHPTILFECAQDSLEPHNISPWDIYEFFRTHDYSLFLIQDWLSAGEALSYERFLSSMEYPFQAFNFLAIPE